MKNPQKFTLNPDFTTEEFEDEILLYAVATGKGVYLNKTAGLVREMCGRGQTVEEIIDLLETTFPEQKNNLRKDIQAAVQSLLEHGALLHADEQSNE